MSPSRTRASSKRRLPPPPNGSSPPYGRLWTATSALTAETSDPHWLRALRVESQSRRTFPNPKGTDIRAIPHVVGAWRSQPSDLRCNGALRVGDWALPKPVGPEGHGLSLSRSV